MKRGDIFVVAQRGVYEGKPRPAVAVQADKSLEHHPSVLFCLLTTELVPPTLFRVPVEATKGSGLSAASQIMIDKVVTVQRDNIGEIVGTLDASTLAELDLGLRLFLGLA